jgi:hypothetical protein
VGELEVDSDVLKWSAESEKKRAKYPFAQKEWKQMENAVKSRLQSVQLGKPQAYKNIAIVPLIAPADGTFQYRTLGEALSAGTSSSQKSPPTAPSRSCWLSTGATNPSS